MELKGLSPPTGSYDDAIFLIFYKYIYIYIYIYIIIVVIFFFFLFQMTGWAGMGGGVIHSLSGSRSPSTPAHLLLPLLVSLSRSLSSGNHPSVSFFLFVGS